MLDDRHYMRPEYRPRTLGLHMPVTILLMIVLVICFALQQIDIAYFGSAYQKSLWLNVSELRHGAIWQLITFQFLHAGLFHLFGNLVGLWFCGRPVEERLGKAHFLTLYLLSGVVGGLFQFLLGLAFPAHYNQSVVGASCGVMAMVAVLALIEPEATFLAFFILPIRAKYLLYVELAVALFFTIVPSDPVYAHAAHLGGILFGVAYLRWGLNLSHKFAEWKPLQRKVRSERMIKAASVRPPQRRRPRPEVPTDLPSDEFISQEVDPILDKISAHGIQSLTERERAILQAARAKMSKR